MVDRTARRKLCEVIRGYLNEQTTAFELDEALQEFCESADEAVRFVAQQLWFFYDDCTDHFVVLNRQSWNYLQRLLLLLESDFQVKHYMLKVTHYSQVIAALLLLIYISVLIMTGMGYHLIAYFLPIGCASILIAHLRRRTLPNNHSCNPFRAALTPFESLADLQQAYEAVDFRKSKYPTRLDARVIRSPEIESPLMLPFYAVWIICAPVVLLFQCLPLRSSQIRVMAEWTAMPYFSLSGRRVIMRWYDRVLAVLAGPVVGVPLTLVISVVIGASLSWTQILLIGTIAGMIAGLLWPKTMLCAAWVFGMLGG